MKKILIVVLFPLLLLGVGLKFCLTPSGFTVSKISSHLAFEKSWEIPSLGEIERQKIEKLLSQPFSFLGAGAQSYAFVSDDGSVVLKFFRMKNFLPKPWHGKAKREKRMARLKRVLGAYKLGYEKLKEESGLLVVHLNRSEDLRKKVQLTDRTGKQHFVDLDSTVFIVQKKAELLYDYLAKSKDQKSALISLFRLILSREQKGIVDEDRGVRNNFGFVNGKVMQIDIGRIAPRENATRDAQVELARVAAKVRAWAEQNQQEVVALLDQALAETMNSE